MEGVFCVVPLRYDYCFEMCCQSQMPRRMRSISTTSEISAPSAPNPPIIDPYQYPIIYSVYHASVHRAHSLSLRRNDALCYSAARKPLCLWYYAHMRKLRVYVACKMTGVSRPELVENARREKATLEEYGMDVFHPVIEEEVPEIPGPMPEPDLRLQDMRWENDQEAIRRADVVIAISPHVWSSGAIREHGKARYDQWKPYVSVWPDGILIPFTAEKEDDACVRSIHEAARVIYERWGTRMKRIKWRLPIYARHWDNVSLRKIVLFFR